MRRLLCWLGFHRPMLGVRREDSWRWTCVDCRTICDGSLSKLARRR